MKFTNTIKNLVLTMLLMTILGSCINHKAKVHDTSTTRKHKHYWLYHGK